METNDRVCFVSIMNRFHALGTNFGKAGFQLEIHRRGELA